jgi:hypothetical protein
MKYTGQTGRPFKTRYQEHIRDFKYGSGKSRFSRLLIDNGNDTGSMQNNVDIVHMTRKGRMMDTLENFTYFVKQS